MPRQGKSQPARILSSDSPADVVDLPGTATGPNSTTPTQTSSQKTPPASVRKTGRAPRALAFMFLGEPGMGKTSLIAQFPRPIKFVLDQFDQGIIDLIDLKRINPNGIILPDEEEIVSPLAESWRQLLKNQDYWMKQWEKNPDNPVNPKPATIAYENIMGMESACWAEYMEGDKRWGGNIEKFMLYRNGPKAAAKFEWPTFIEQINCFRSMGITVCMSGHTTVATKGAVETEHAKSFGTADAATIEATVKDFNFVGHIALNYSTTIVGSGDHKKHKAEKSAGLKVICHQSPLYNSCKNHFGITEELYLPPTPAKAYEMLMKEARLDPKTCRPL